MKVQFTKSGLARFHEILDLIGESNRFALRRFPSSGSAVREFPGLQLREFLVEPYRFVYYIDEPRRLVRIVAVWHGAQLPATPELPAP
jgi:plasmid stabilization system protein ParE